MKRFFSSSKTKKKCIHTTLKILSVAIEINIKGHVEIEEMKKIWLRFHENGRWRDLFFIVSIFIEFILLQLK